LKRDAVDICAHLFKHGPTSGLVTSWALQTTQSVIRAKVEELSKKEYRLCFHASTTTVEQIESSFMPLLVGKIRQFAPSLWIFIFTLLGALDKQHLCHTVDPMGIDLSEVFEESERSLGDLGGD
ncbi:hypothetical protein BJY52DRAFT_1109658, partial [Lactarius psammicola]